MKKKVILVLLCITLCAGVFADSSISFYVKGELGSTGYSNDMFKVTLNGNVYEKDSKYYFKDTVKYSWEATLYGTFLGIDGKYEGTDSDIIDKDGTTTITMKADYYIKILGKWYKEGLGHGKFSVIADNTAPKITITPSVTSSKIINGYNYFNKLINISCTAVDDGCGTKSVSYKLDGKSVNSSFSITTEGYHTIAVTAEDNLGNKDTSYYYVFIDSGAPTLKVQKSNDSEWVQSTTVIASASDASGLIKPIKYSVNGAALKESPSTGCSLVIGESPYSANGTYDIKFTVEDYAGFSAEKSTTVKIDKEPPVVTVSDYLSGWQEHLTLSASAEDGNWSQVNDATWQYTNNNGKTWSSEGASNNLKEITEEGEYDVIFKVKDNAGNVGLSDVLHIQIDNKPPIIKPFGRVTKDSKLTVSASDSSSGIKNIKWKINAGDWQEGATAQLHEGSYQLSFQVTDEAGHVTEKTEKIIRDTTPPILAFNVPSHLKENTIKLENFSVIDALSDTITLSCAFDKQTPVQFTKTETPEFDITNLTDGNHTITVVADDNHGNLQKITVSFIIDKTNPVINSVSFTSSGMELLENQLIQVSQPVLDRIVPEVVVSVTASDTFNSVSEGMFKPADIKSYCWKLDSQSGWTEENSNQFCISSFIPGTNTIHIKSVDLSGNESTESVFTVIYDDSIPNTPNITSNTHRKATKPEDAICNSDASFVIKAAENGIYGTYGYVWKLYTGALSADGSINQSTLSPVSGYEDQILSMGNIFIENLEDNEKDEFYILSVQTRGKNNALSRDSYFVFRIDTKPPENYTFWLVPQTDPETWYNNSNVQLNWQEKYELNEESGQYEKTGLMLVDYAVCPKTSVEETPNWIPINDATDNTFWIQTSGHSVIKMRFTDYAGNQYISETECKVDVVSPTVSEGNASIVWDGNRLAIQWPEFADSESGMDYISVKITSLDSDGFIRTTSTDAESNDITFTEIPTDKNYLVSITGFDKAGNSSAMTAITNGPNCNEEIQTVTMEYSEFKNGYAFEGTITYNPNNASPDSFTGTVKLPESLEVYRNGQKIKSFEVDSSTAIFSGFEIESVKSSSASNKPYSIEIDGKTITCSVIGYSKTAGLVLEDVKYIQPGSNETQELSFNWAHTGFQPLVLNTGKADLNDTSLTVETDGFTLNGIEEIYFENSIEILNGSSVNIVPSKINIKTAAGDNSLELTDIRITRNTLTANLKDNNSVLTLGDNVLTVRKAEVKSNSIFINEAEAPILINGVNYILVFKNFSIDDTTGNVDGKYLSVSCKKYENDGAYTEVTNLSDGIVSISVSDIRLDDNGKVVVDGKYFYQDLPVNSLLLESSGISYQQSEMSNLNIYLFGYQVRAQNVAVMADGIHINGNITIFDNLCTLTGLVWNPGQEQPIIEEGSVIETISADKKLYGKDVIWSNMKISAEGLKGDIDVPLPVECNINDTESVIVNFRNALIHEDGTCIAYSSDETVFKYSGYQLTSSDFNFDGTVLTVQSGSIDVTGLGFCEQNADYKEFFKGLDVSGDLLEDTDASLDEYYARQNSEGTPNTICSLDFKNLSFDYNNIQNEAIINNPETFTKGKWRFYFDSYVLNEEGINGSGYLGSIISETGAVFKLAFDDFLIMADGEIVSSKSSANELESRYIVNYYYYDLPEAELVKEGEEYFLHAERPEFKGLGQEESLYFNSLWIKDDGNVVKSDISNEVQSFRSVNRFDVTATALKITTECPLICGEVRDSALSLYTEFNDFEIRINQIFYILLDKSDCDITYVYNNWNMVGKGFSCDFEDFTIEENYALFNNQKIPLGTIKFSAVRGIYGNVSKSSSFTIDEPFNDTTIMYIDFSRDGLFADVAVALPAPFDSVFVPFRNVELFPDGSIQPHSACSERVFTLGDTRISFDNITIDKESVKVGKIKLTLPESAQNVEIELRGLNFYKDGTFKLEGSSVNPVKIFDMIFTLKNLSFDSEGFSFSGYVTLPSSMPGILAGKTIGFEDFSMNYDGSNLNFDIQALGTYVIPFMDSWSLKFTDFSINYNAGKPALVFSDCLLVFPTNFKVQNVSITDLSYSILDQKFDFEKISVVTDFSYTLGGIKLSMNELTIVKDSEISMKGSALFEGEQFPVFLQNKTTNATIGISTEGKLTTLDIGMSGLSGQITKDITAVELRDGSVAVRKNSDDSIYLALSGGLWFTETAPKGMQDVKLTINNFIFDCTQLSVTELIAKAEGFSPIIGSVQFSDISAGIAWYGGDDGTISCSGNLILPDTLPDGLKGTVVGLNEFEIGFDGKVKEFDASYDAPGPCTMLDGIILSNIKIAIGLDDNKPLFTIASDMKLSEEKFPSGIGGLTSSAEFSFKGTELQSVKASATLKNKDFFDAFHADNISFKLIKDPGTDLILDFAGDVTLNNVTAVPASLAGTRFTVSKCQFTAGGKLLDFKAGAAFPNQNLFDFVTLKNPEFEVTHSEEDGFLFTINGGVALSAPSIPDSIKKSTLRITDCKISTKNGVKSFNAALDKAASFTILKGIGVSLDSLSVGSSGFSCSATATLNYTGPAKGTSFTINKLSMDWNGNIKELSGGLKYTSIKIAGFNGSISSLTLEKDASVSGGFYVSLNECSLTLPQNMGSMGGKSLKIQDATFKNGTFQGKFVVPNIEFDIVGFTVKLENPGLDFQKNEITFTKTSLNMPQYFANANVGLNGVKVSASSGLTFSGAEFRIPDFTIGGGFKFQNVYVNFAKQGSNYSIEGAGGLTVPGAGTMSAKLAFTNKSKEYPIGIKNAEFNFEAAVGKGIPIGTTGLYMTGIGGGLSYGSCSNDKDMPSDVKKMFTDNGIRIKLQVTASDVTGGTLVKITPKTWIDVENVQWGFYGNVSIMKGFLSANASAALGNYGFSTTLNVNLAFVNGKATLNIFDDQGAKFTGSANVKFGVRAGTFVNKSWTVKILGWKKTYSLKIPSSDYWLFGIGAEFGYFKNKEKGFKGVIDVPLWGEQGVFVGTDGIHFKGVSSYTLWEPPANTGRSVTNLNRAVRSAITGEFETEIDKGTTNIHYFTINGEDNPGIVIGANTSMATGARSATDGTDSSESGISGLNTIVFICCFPEGDPAFCAISPNGTRYYPGMDEVETEYTDEYVAFSIVSPESGNWSFEVAGLDQDMYAVEIVTILADPEVTVTEPSWYKENAEESLYVAGATNRSGAEVTVYASEDTESGYIELGTITAGDDGLYSGYLSTEKLLDGEYLISAIVIDSNGMMSERVYSNGSYMINRANIPMKAPINFRFVERENNSVNLTWDNENGMRTKGYILQLNRDGEVEETDIGNITTYSMSGFENNETITACIKAYDSYGNESAYTEALTVKINAEKETVNIPSVQSTPYVISGSACDTVDGSLIVKIEAYEETGTELDYIRGMLTSEFNSECFIITFDDFVKITDDTVEVPFNILISDTCPEGTYQIEGKVVNDGNFTLESDFVITLQVSYPAPQIEWVDKTTIDGTEENVVTINGNGFINGTTFFFDGVELTVEQNESDLVTQKTVKIPVTTTRGTKQLTAVNPDGVSASIDIQVTVPGWEILPLVDSLSVKIGESAVLPVTVNQIDDYMGQIELPQAVSIPGVLAEATGITLGQNDITVYVNKTAVEGSYVLHIGGEGEHGFDIPLNILPEDKVLPPEITQMNPYSVFSGNTVKVYGNGFGNEGSLIYEYEEAGEESEIIIETSTWTDSYITFVVPSYLKTGYFHIENENGSSGYEKLYVKERSFSIRPEQSAVTLIREKSKDIKLYINGYAEKADLTVSMDDRAPFEVFLADDSVIPNAVDVLTIVPREDAYNGVWTIVIRGTCENYSSETSIMVEVKDRLTLNTSDVYQGTLGSSYRAELITENAIGKTEFSIIEGDLPSGLSMNQNGVISGTPISSGEKIFTVQVTDEEGQKASEEVSITIKDDMWARQGKDGGNSRSTASDIPASSEKEWLAETGVVDAEIIVGDRIIFSHNNSVLTAFSDKGRFLWSLDSKFEKVELCGSYLYANKNNTLYAIDKRFGNTAWTREGVTDFYTGENIILAEENDGFTILNAHDGTVITLDLTGSTSKNEIFFVADKVYEIVGSEIKCISGNAKELIANEQIRNVSADSAGFVITTDKKVYVCDNAFNLKGQIDLVDENEQVITALDATGIFILEGNSLTEYTRNGLDIRWKHDGILDFAVANEKVAAITENGICVINRYSGKDIWNEDGTYSSIALYSEKLFAMKYDGILACYVGKPNIQAPFTTIVSDKDGTENEKGWFNETPTVIINAEDSETYVSEIKVKINEDEYSSFAEGFVLPDGYSSIAAYSTDSKGWKSAPVYRSFQVDTTKPEIRHKLSTKGLFDSWCNSEVELTLEAADATSGIEGIYLNDTRYENSVTYAHEGIYELEWYAEDNAGNRSNLVKHTLMLDFFAPYAEIDVAEDYGISVVKLTGNDSGSGLQRLEYSIDDGAVQIYEEPVVILDTGWHTFKYRALDKSGKYSQWQQRSINVLKEYNSSQLMGLINLNGIAPETGKLDYSSPLYTWNVTGDRNRDGIPQKYWSDVYDRFWERAYFNTLPAYVLGSDYIRYKATDLMIEDQRDISFYLKKDAVIYMFAAPDMNVDESWTLIDEHAMIQSGWYREGWKLYMRRADKAELITVNAGERPQALPIIAVKEDLKVTAKITLERSDAWDDIYYKGRKTYRSGVMIHLDVVETPDNIGNAVPVTKKWLMTMNGKTVNLADLYYHIPEVSQSTDVTFTYEITGLDGEMLARDELTITVSPPDKPEDVYPWY